jgi:hypothetical protein
MSTKTGLSKRKAPGSAGRDKHFQLLMRRFVEDIRYTSQMFRSAEPESDGIER